jgi:hypothetical protein
MICLGRDKNGEVQCAQATYLDPKNANKADLDVKKELTHHPPVRRCCFVVITQATTKTK